MRLDRLLPLPGRPLQDALRRAGVAMLAAVLASGTLAATPLADQPINANVTVPGNLALVLSVEYPTAVSVAHLDTVYNPTSTYLGYFDPEKCYRYSYSSTEANRHFYPAGLASAHSCTTSNTWSGNFMNWATMQTVDPFRWVLTGGYRSTDTSTSTILEKAWASGQGDVYNFPDRSLGTAALVSGATPLSWTSLSMRVQGLGNKMRFTQTGDVYAATATNFQEGLSSTTAVYEVSVRVKVCDSSGGAGGLETNCTAYGSSYKPTGLIQRYADQIRFSAFGYLNDSNLARDGGVMRARQKFVGPTMPVVGGADTTNAAAEWSGTNGILVTNPDTADASSTSAATGVTVANSGVINYLNKFGQITPGNYKSYDPVGELYYAALRYFRKLGNVSEWSNMGSADAATKTTWVDGFPVITNWDDPIQYSCQKNFILGIGDVNTHADRNLPGATGLSEPAQPAAVAADTTMNALTSTNKVGVLHGLGSTLGDIQDYNGCCSSNGALMAGMAYWANTQDIRPDDAADLARTKGRQSVQTYWLDVLEYQTYKPDNQFYLAAKYGGFVVPETFDAWSRTTDIPASWWTTSGDLVGTQARPDTYYTASRADQMVQGLTDAFASIAARLRSFTTAFATSMPQIANSGVASYATQFDSKSWSGELIANEATLDATTGSPTLVESWRFSNTLGTQAAGTGWDTNRRIATWNTGTGTGVPFRLASLSSAQQTALDTSYRIGIDAGDFVNYVRGQRLHEKSSTAVGSAKAYRDRVTLVGDIGNFKMRVVGPPDSPLNDSTNPGYAAFKTSNASRQRVVYLGTNAGMVHAVNGDLTGTNAGRELWAYVPGAVIAGPTGTASTNGLQTIGNPAYSHLNFVDAPPAVADVDFGKTAGGSGTNWRTVLVGGLGKGGKAVYALDITDPTGATTETAVATKVLWEFSHADLGYTYGEPAIVKTKKHGWVVIVGSGYNNADGKGYLFILNARTGALLEKIGTGVGSTTTDAGLAHVQAFLLDRTDGTADSVYAGDLLGNLWRWDLTGTGTLPAPLKLAALTDSGGASLAVTARPLVVVHPENNRRYVTVGTGRLLHSSDVASSQAQRFFAIIDGNAGRFGRADGSDLPSGISYPITTAQLKANTDPSTKIVLDYNTQVGWYLDLGAVAGSSSLRIITDSTSFYGTVSFAATLPVVSSNPCEPTGSNRVYALDLGTGQSRLTDSGGSTVLPYVSTLVGTITDLRFFSVAGTARLIAGSNGGGTTALPGKWATADGLRRLNWREVPLNE